MTKSEQKIIETAKKRFQLSASADSKDRRDRLDDMRFVRLGEQWPEGIRRDRSMPGRERPMLTINRIFQFRNQVINEIRQNKPTIKIRPVDDKADVDTAEVIQGIIRHIEDASHADIAYDTAVEWQVDCGLGYFRVCTDYVDDGSFDQEILIKRVPDAFKVYMDNGYTEPDASDAKWALVIEDIPRDDFEDKYPDVKLVDWEGGGIGDGWVTANTVRIADYYEIKVSDRKLAQMADGSVAHGHQLTEDAAPYIVKTRPVEKKTCIYRKIGGNAILEETEIPTSYIPIIPVLGNEVWLDGVRHLHGLTRFGKDAQRQYNFLQSANAEALALAPRVPYVGYVGQFTGHEAEWEQANRVNLAYLEVEPMTVMGTLVGLPQRTPAVGTNPGFEAGMQRAVDDLKASMGIYDSSLGNREGDQSGRAIQSQQQQASIGNFHFSDNLSRSFRHLGRILLEMIPKVYDTPRVARILGEDGSQKTAKIMPGMGAASMDAEDAGEIGKIYDPGVGKYDVVVDVGPSYMTKRQEAVAAQVQLVQANPAIMSVAGDLIVRSMDWPGADELADRLKKALPPNLQDAQGDEGQPEQSPEMQQATAQMHQMADQMQHMSQALQQLQSDKDERDRKLAIEEFDAITRRILADNQVALAEGKMHEYAVNNMAALMAMPPPGSGGQEPSQTQPEPGGQAGAQQPEQA